MEEYTANIIIPVQKYWHFVFSVILIISAMILFRHLKMILGSVGDQYRIKQITLKSWSYKQMDRMKGRRITGKIFIPGYKETLLKYPNC